MSRPDDYVSEMIAIHQIDDPTAEALLTGRAVADELASLTEVMQAYRRVARQPVRPSAALAQQMAAGRFTGAVEYYEPDRSASRGRRRRPSRSAARTAWVVAFGGVAAAVAGVGAAGFAGVLPDPAQDRFESVVETVTPYDFPKQANENENAEFGEEVSEDATDGGVDGDEVSERAREQGDERGPDGLPTVAPDQPGKPSDRPTPANPEVPTPTDRGPGEVPVPPGEGLRPSAPPGQ